MFKRTNTSLSAGDVATMLAHAASSFERLAAMNAAVSCLSDQPKLARDLALATQEMAEGLAENFGEYKREYEAVRALTPAGEVSN
jgi:hypothetical protein